MGHVFNSGRGNRPKERSASFRSRGVWAGEEPCLRRSARSTRPATPSRLADHGELGTAAAVVAAGLNPQSPVDEAAAVGAVQFHGPTLNLGAHAVSLARASAPSWPARGQRLLPPPR